MEPQAEQLHPNWRALATLNIPMKRFIPEGCIIKDNQLVIDEKRELDKFNGEEIEQFYKQVIEKNIKISKNYKQENAPIKTEYHNTPQENFDKQRFHCYATENKAEKLLQISYKDNDINTLDNYGWSGLMMSACAGATEAIKVLLRLGANRAIKDKSQRTAKDLALKKGFYHIAELLENPTSPDCQADQDKVPISYKQKPLKPFYCSECKQTFMETAPRQHYTSTVHQFNVRSSLPLNKLQKFNIPSRNKGLQLMVKQGWDKESGLGPSQNGRLYPVKTVIRKRRSGLGVEQQVARVTHFQAFDREAVRRHNSDYYSKKPHGKDKPRNRNDIRKERQRERKHEKRLRHELS
ncbi:G patch domain and ankyrin repeat-containing protein 1 homolog [Glossina fuscipes fuscipes]